jgi:hypothetical protein
VLDASEPHRTRRSGGLDEWDRTPLHTMESAENGEFEFMNILPGSYRVLVNAEGFAPFPSAAFVVTE